MHITSAAGLTIQLNVWWGASGPIVGVWIYKAKKKKKKKKKSNKAKQNFCRFQEKIRVVIYQLLLFMKTACGSFASHIDFIDAISRFHQEFLQPTYYAQLIDAPYTECYDSTRSASLVPINLALQELGCWPKCFVLV